MPAKDIAAKSWAIVASFDGRKYSAYAAGDKPSGYQTSPTLLDTDIIDGPLTGGENNKGIFMVLYGYSFGRKQDVGLPAGARVYFRINPSGTWYEVDNYRYMLPSPVFSRLQVVKLGVQLGALGSPAAGSVMDIKVVVNGVDSNILASQFTVQPGRIAFVDPATGDDSTALFDDPTKPFRYAQKSVGGANSYTGLWAANIPTGAAGLRAGDTVVFRAGTYGDNAGFDGRFVRFRSHTGSAPNGTIGNGYIKFITHPGSILGNAPEDMHFVDPASGKGGFQGVNTAYGGTYGMYVVISGMRMECAATSVSDSGPINLQTAANYWRVFGNTLGPWPSTLVTPSNAKSAGIAGNGNPVKIKFNTIFGIDCDANNPSTSALENHGVYLDGSNNCAANVEVAHNWIYNIYGGSGIQCYATAPADTFTGISIHHNFVDTCYKHGINLSDKTRGVDVYNNIVCNTKQMGIRFQPTTNPAINIVHNTVYNPVYANNGSVYGGIEMEGTITTGSVKVLHNIVALGAGRGHSNVRFYVGNGTDTNVTLQKNLYYDYAGVELTRPSKDDGSSTVNSDPLFTDKATKQFTLLTGSPALNIANGTEPLTVDTDIYGIARPQSSTPDMGATEGVGT